MCIFNKSKQRSHNSDNTHHFSLTIDNTPALFPDQTNFLTLQLSDNTASTQTPVDRSNLDLHA